jgi:hypothetical protein
MINQIHQAGVARGRLHDQADNLAQHFIERKIRVIAAV